MVSPGFLHPPVLRVRSEIEGGTMELARLRMPVGIPQIHLPCPSASSGGQFCIGQLFAEYTGSYAHLVRLKPPGSPPGVPGFCVLYFQGFSTECCTASSCQVLQWAGYCCSSSLAATSPLQTLIANFCSVLVFQLRGQDRSFPFSLEARYIAARLGFNSFALLSGSSHLPSHGTPC